MRSPDARDCFFVARHPKRVKLQLNCDDTGQYRFTKTNTFQVSCGIDIDIVKPVDMTVLKESLGETFLTLERRRDRSSTAWSGGDQYELSYMRALRYGQSSSPGFQTQFFKGWPIAMTGSYGNHPCLTVKFPTKWSCRKVLKITFDVDFNFNGTPYQEHFEAVVYNDSPIIITFSSEVPQQWIYAIIWRVRIPNYYIFTGYNYNSSAYPQTAGPISLCGRQVTNGILSSFAEVYLQDNIGFPVQETVLHNRHVDFSGVLKSFDHNTSFYTIEINSCSLSGESYYELYEVDGDGFGALSCFYAIPDLMLDQFRPKMENVKMYQMDMNQINTNGQNWVTANNANLLDDFIDASVFLDSVEW